MNKTSKITIFIVAFIATLIVVLVPAINLDNTLPTRAQDDPVTTSPSPEYELEVFSGIQGADNVRLS